MGTEVPSGGSGLSYHSAARRLGSLLVTLWPSHFRALWPCGDRAEAEHPGYRMRCGHFTSLSSGCALQRLPKAPGGGCALEVSLPDILKTLLSRPHLQTRLVFTAQAARETGASSRPRKL